MRREETGASLVIVAVMMAVLMLFLALVVDVGYWYVVRAQLQSAADSAALAGAAELAQTGDEDDARVEARTYASHNAVNPVHSISTVVDVDMAAQAVKVTVSTQASSFYQELLDYFEAPETEGRIRAQARAIVGYVSGTRSPVPWALPVIRVGEMRATMGGVTIPLSASASGSGRWEGTFPADVRGSITLRATNGQGYTETFANQGAVGFLPPGGRFAAINVSRTTLTSGLHGSVIVDVTLRSPLASGGSIKADGGGTNVTLTSADGVRFFGTVPVPGTSDAYRDQELSVEIREGSSKQSVSCVLLVRRSNYLIEDVSFQPAFAATGAAVYLSVKTLAFQYGARYQLKVEGGSGEVGGFLAVDLNSLDHSTCEFGGSAGSYGGGADYREFISGVSELVIHIGDTLTTLPGSKTGPTAQGIRDRMPGTLMSFDEWNDQDRPPTPQVVIVPITERLEDPGGRTVLRVESFASFFIEQRPSSSGDPVIGRFIDYVSPAVVVGPNPPNPGGFHTRAPLLVAEGRDF